MTLKGRLSIGGEGLELLGLVVREHRGPLQFGSVITDVKDCLLVINDAGVIDAEAIAGDYLPVCGGLGYSVEYRHRLGDGLSRPVRESKIQGDRTIRELGDDRSGPVGTCERLADRCRI